MDTELLIQSLERHILLHEAEKDLIRKAVRLRKLKKNQFIVHEGGIQRCTNFVNAGSLRTYYVDSNGEEHIVQFAIEGWWISDLHSFIMQVPAAFNVQAIEDSEILELPYDQLEMLYEKVPMMERYFRIITQRAFVSFQQRIVQKNSLTAEERYVLFREKYPLMDQRIPQRLIASYLGMSAEFLSKIKKRLYEKEKYGKE